MRESPVTSPAKSQNTSVVKDRQSELIILELHGLRMKKAGQPERRLRSIIVLGVIVVEPIVDLGEKIENSA